MFYVGVDAHKSTSQITIMNEAGEVLRRKRVPSAREGFQATLAGLVSFRQGCMTYSG